MHGDCDGICKHFDRKFDLSSFRLLTENILRAINDLIALIKKLQQDIANQHADIRRLNSLIENCAGCREPASLRLDICQYANPCFTGKWL
jgi:Cartilage oligomeric matrix protein